jgi:FkbM family methyltransferase
MIKDFFPRLLKKIHLLERINLFPFIRVNNKKFIIPVIHGLGRLNLYLHKHEPWISPLLKKLLPIKKGTFIDVGVNIGQTLLWLKSIEPEIPYLGFEPNISCVYYTRWLIKKNQFKNTVVVPVGLSHENNLSDFRINIELDAEATIITSLRRPDRPINETLFIPVFSFDSLKSLPGLENVGVIKIDVEGAELEVIEGMKGLIAGQRPIILCEVLHAYTGETVELKKDRNHRLSALLGQFGYHIFRIIKSGDERQVKGLSEVTVFDDSIWSDLTSTGLCDYLFVPEELKGLMTRGLFH